MNTHCTFKHMDSTEALKKHAEEMANKLLKYGIAEIDATWVFSVEGDSHVAHLHIKGPHLDLYGQGETENMYDSIESACEKVEKQLKKHKEIAKNHLHRG